MGELFIEGGVEYMTTITLMLLVIIGLAGTAAYRHLTRGRIDLRLVEGIRQIGMLALAFGVFATVLGFFHALRSLSEMTETLPFYVIMGGLKVALITSLYGMIVFLFAFALSIGVNALARKNIS